MMRLTLRTLLAYLDDVLSPADTKIIGEKIQESPMAQLLVSRIREVMRRRRLKAPEVFGPEMGIDPNIVSQYLDNSLPADRYADVERVLLASDELLAEAAACHQILTVVLADPSEVPSASRDRLYALGPVDVTSKLTSPSEPSHATASRTPHSIATRNNSIAHHETPVSNSHRNDEPIRSVPDYLRPTPLWKRLFPSGIVALLILACAFLLAPDLITGLRQANNEMQRKLARNQTPVSESTDDANHVADANGVGGELNLKLPEIALPPSPSPPVTDRLTIPKGLDPMPPADAPDNVPTPATAVAMKDKNSDAPADAQAAAKPKMNVPVENPPKANPPPPEPVADVVVNYTSNEGVLIRFDEAQQHWLMVPHRSELKSGETIASIEPFESALDFDRGSLRLTLIGETVCKLLNPGTVGATGLGIRKGRFVIQNIRTDDRAATIGISIGDDIWNLELSTGDTVCGLEVIPREATQFQKLQDYHWYQATIYVISGSAKWTNVANQTQEIGDHLALNIIPEKDALIRSTPVSFPAIPDWCDSVKRKATLARRHQYNVQFEKSFELNQPVEESMLLLVKSSKKPKIAEMAAQCLSAIENYSALVETLAVCQHEEARFAARDGLRQWLPLQPDRGLKLIRELESHYPPTEADAIYQMLWGFSRDDVTNSKPTAWLFLNWMRSPRIEIRELADYWVERLIGRKTDYRAADPQNQRESHVRRLEELVEKHNGLIKAP